MSNFLGSHHFVTLGVFFLCRTSKCPSHPNVFAGNAFVERGYGTLGRTALGQCLPNVFVFLPSHYMDWKVL